MFAGGHSFSTDEEGYFLQSRAILHGDYALTITGDAAPVTAAYPGRDGKPVGPGGIGAPLAGVPALAIGTAVATLTPDRWDDVVERLFAGFTNSLITAAIVAMLFLCARRMGVTRHAATLLALAFGLGSMAWPHAKTMLFTEPLAALLVLTAVYFALCAAESASWRLAAWSGGFAGLAGAARLSTLMFALPIGLYLLAKHRSRAGVRMATGYAAGVAAGLAFIGLTNLWRTGSLFDTGYTNVPLDGSLWTGLHGFLFSTGKSIFIYAPFALVAVAALPLAFRRKPLETSLLGVIVGANLLLFARFPMWHGDHAWGPRYLNITLPLLALIVAPVLAERSWHRALVVAAVAGVAINSLGTFVGFNQYLVQLNREVAAPEPQSLRYLDEAHLTPSRSPIVGHTKLLDDNVAGTARGVNDGIDFPSTPRTRLYSYFRPQIETWWYWVRSLRAPGWLLLLGVVPVVCVAFGARRLRSDLERTRIGGTVVLLAAAAVAGVFSLVGPGAQPLIWLFMALSTAGLAVLILAAAGADRRTSNAAQGEPLPTPDAVS